MSLERENKSNDILDDLARRNRNLDKLERDFGSLEEDLTAQLAQIAYQFETVEDMINNRGLKTGDRVETWGYYSKGDGGGGSYIITETPDGYSEPLINGLEAELLHDSIVNVKKIGIVSFDKNKKSENSEIFKHICENYGYKLYFPIGEYYLSNILLDNVRTVFIEGETDRLNPDASLQSIIITDGDDFLNTSAEGVGFYINNLRFISENQKGTCFRSVDSGETLITGKNIVIEKFEYGFYAPNFSTSCNVTNLNLTQNMFGFYSEKASHYSKFDGVLLNYNKIGMRISGVQVSVKHIHFGAGYFGRHNTLDEEFNIGLQVKQQVEIDSLYVESYGQDTSKSILIDFEHNHWDGGNLLLKRSSFPALIGDWENLYAHIRTAKIENRYHTANEIIFENCFVSDLKIVEKNGKFIRGLKVNDENTWNLPSSAGFNQYEATVISDGTLFSGPLNYSRQFFRYPLSDILNHEKIFDVENQREYERIYNEGRNTLDLMDSGMYEVTIALNGNVEKTGKYSFILEYLNRDLKQVTIDIGSIDVVYSTLAGVNLFRFNKSLKIYATRRGVFNIGLKADSEKLTSNDFKNMYMDLHVKYAPK